MKAKEKRFRQTELYTELLAWAIILTVLCGAMIIVIYWQAIKNVAYEAVTTPETQPAPLHTKIEPRCDLTLTTRGAYEDINIFNPQGYVLVTISKEALEKLDRTRGRVDIDSHNVIRVERSAQ